jgi:anti-sigma regulatory factor (Ser/Thr protein kinase)
MDPTPDRLEVLLRNQPADISLAHDLLDEIVARRGLSSKLANDLHVAIEEHLTNTIRYGYAPGQSGRIRVRFRPAVNELCVEIEDDARPFNPLVAPRVDVTRPIDERPIGGLGIHMIRQLTDELRYERQGDRNRLIMVKRLPNTGSP